MLVDKFMNNNTPIQVLCLQESWFSTDTDLSLYNIPGYHMISTEYYASNHGGLVIYLHNKWDYVLKTCNTVSKLWERQIIEVYDPTIMYTFCIFLKIFVSCYFSQIMS